MRQNDAVKVRIAIADDHPFFLQGLQTFLDKQPDFHVIGLANNGAELINLVQQKQPDVVLTDIQMPKVSGIEATVRIIKEYPQTGIIAISMFAEQQILLDMHKAGAKGYLLKDSSTEEVIQAVKTVHNKGFYYCCDIINKMAQLLDLHTKEVYSHINTNADLTKKEETIMRLICQELSSKEIADHLTISTRSVESIRERLLDKIGAKNMVGIAFYAVKHGLHRLQ